MKERSIADVPPSSSGDQERKRQPSRMARKTTKSGQKELERTFDAVDSILRNHDAGLLVAANAALRLAAGTTGTMETI